MFNLIKRGVKSMAKTVNNIISNDNEVELAKLKIVEECIKGVGNALKGVGNTVEKSVKGVGNALKDPHTRKVAGVIMIGLGVGLIASSNV